MGMKAYVRIKGFCGFSVSNGSTKNSSRVYFVYVKTWTYLNNENFSIEKQRKSMSSIFKFAAYLLHIYSSVVSTVHT